MSGLLASADESVENPAMRSYSILSGFRGYLYAPKMVQSSKIIRTFYGLDIDALAVFRVVVTRFEEFLGNHAS